ncbi:mCG147132 [Mus musculus]|nr:mCG147132 [Mus musculus]
MDPMDNNLQEMSWIKNDYVLACIMSSTMYGTHFLLVRWNVGMFHSLG